MNNYNNNQADCNGLVPQTSEHVSAFAGNGNEAVDLEMQESTDALPVNSESQSLADCSPITPHINPLGIEPVTVQPNSPSNLLPIIPATEYKRIDRNCQGSKRSQH